MVLMGPTYSRSYGFNAHMGLVTAPFEVLGPLHIWPVKSRGEGNPTT